MFYFMKLIAFFIFIGLDPYLPNLICLNFSLVCLLNLSLRASYFWQEIFSNKKRPFRSLIQIRSFLNVCKVLRRLLQKSGWLRSSSAWQLLSRAVTRISFLVEDHSCFRILACLLESVLLTLIWQGLITWVDDYRLSEKVLLWW